MSNSLEPSKRGFLSFRETRKTSECEKNGRKLLHRSVHSFQFARSPQQGEKIEAEKWLTRRKKMFCAQILFFVTDHWSKLFEFLFMCLWDVWDSLLSLYLSRSLACPSVWLCYLSFALFDAAAAVLLFQARCRCCCRSTCIKNLPRLTLSSPDEALNAAKSGRFSSHKKFCFVLNWASLLPAIWPCSAIVHSCQ